MLNKTGNYSGIVTITWKKKYVCLVVFTKFIKSLIALKTKTVFITVQVIQYTDMDFITDLCEWQIISKSHITKKTNFQVGTCLCPTVKRLMKKLCLIQYYKIFYLGDIFILSVSFSC